MKKVYMVILDKEVDGGYGAAAHVAGIYADRETAEARANESEFCASVYEVDFGVETDVKVFQYIE